MEILRLRRLGRDIPTYIDKMIWRNPSKAEDWVNLLCFIERSDITLLIDIGANLGEFSRSFRRLFHRSHIVAFEPASDAFEVMKYSFKEHKNVFVENIGISDISGEKEMYVPKDNKLSGFAAYTDNLNTWRKMDIGNLQTVNVSTLDSYESTIEKMKNTASVDKVVVKIDVQGHELNVLNGGGTVLRKADMVLCECTFAPVYKGLEPSFSRVCSILYEHGLRPIIFQDYGYQASNYAMERDVLFVKPHLLNNILLSRPISNSVKITT